MSNISTEASKLNSKKDAVPSTHTTVSHQQAAKLDVGHIPTQQTEVTVPPSDQELISSSLILFGQMKKKYPHQLGQSLDYDTCEFVPSDSKQFPPLLDWISLYFAQGKDDVVASAMTHDNRGATLTIHLAHSRGCVAAQNKSVCAEFKSMLTTILEGNTSLKQGQNGTDHDYNKVLTSLIGMCWTKIESTIQKLQDFVRSTHQGGNVALGKLDGMLTFWLNQHQDISADTVRSGTLEFLTSVMGLDSHVSTVDGRISCLKNAIHACQKVADLGYLEVANSCDDGWTESADKNYLLRLELSYVINRLLDYHHGTEIFLSWGVPNLFKPRLLTGEHVVDIDAKLKFKWVNGSEILHLPEKHPTWQMNSDDWFVNYVRSRPNKFYIAENKPTQRDAAIRDATKNLWKKDDTMATMVHVEVQMVYYLQHERITPMYKAIGMSKPLCVTCEAYFHGLRNAVGDREQWAVRSASGKLVKDWICPPYKDTLVKGQSDWDLTAAYVTINSVGGSSYSFLTAILDKVAADK